MKELVGNDIWEQTAYAHGNKSLMNNNQIYIDSMGMGRWVAGQMDGQRQTDTY